MEAVAKHLIMAGTWMDDDPKLALRHARAAKDRAGRVAVAREANGIAAYHAGEWLHFGWLHLECHRQQDCSRG